MAIEASSKPAPRFAVVVVGSGTVAHVTALAMSARGLATAIVHHPVPALPDTALDERIFAITPPNQRFLAKLGFWQKLDPARIADIAEMRIHPHAERPENTSPLRLAAMDAGVERLAAMVEHRALLQVGDDMVRTRAAEAGSMLQGIEAKTVVGLTQMPDAVRLHFAEGNDIEAKLLIAADGADSLIRRWLSLPISVDHYGDSCIVGNFQPERFHRHCAEQWYYPDGVIAALPIAHEQISLAWSCRQSKAESLANDLPALLQAMFEATQGKLGQFTSTSPVRTYPLRRMQSSRTVVGRVILAGDSAHLVHPMLGLGLNLGLGDVSEIVQHFGSLPALSRMGKMSAWAYERKRQREVLAIQTLTHSLHRVYLQNHPWLPKLGGFGMAALEKSPWMKEVLIRAVTH